MHGTMPRVLLEHHKKMPAYEPYFNPEPVDEAEYLLAAADMKEDNLLLSQDEQIVKEEWKAKTKCHLLQAQDQPGPNGGHYFARTLGPLGVGMVPSWDNVNEILTTDRALEVIESNRKAMYEDQSRTSHVSRIGTWTHLSDAAKGIFMHLPNQDTLKVEGVMAQAKWVNAVQATFIMAALCMVTAPLLTEGRNAKDRPSPAFSALCLPDNVKEAHRQIRRVLGWGQEAFEQYASYFSGLYAAAIGITPMGMLPKHPGIYSSGHTTEIPPEAPLAKISPVDFRMLSGLLHTYSLVEVRRIFSARIKVEKGFIAIREIFLSTASLLLCYVSSQTAALHGIRYNKAFRVRLVELIVDLLVAKSPLITLDDLQTKTIKDKLDGGTKARILLAVDAHSPWIAMERGMCSVSIISGLDDVIALGLSAIADYQLSTMLTVQAQVHVISDTSFPLNGAHFPHNRAEIFSIIRKPRLIQLIKEASTAGAAGMLSLTGSFASAFRRQHDERTESLSRPMWTPVWTGDSGMLSRLGMAAFIGFNSVPEAAGGADILRVDSLGGVGGFQSTNAVLGGLYHAYGVDKSEAARHLGDVDRKSRLPMTLDGDHSPIRISTEVLQSAQTTPILLTSNPEWDVYLFVKGYQKLVVLGKGLDYGKRVPMPHDVQEGTCSIIIVPGRFPGGGFPHRDEPEVPEALHNQSLIAAARVYNDAGLNEVARHLLGAWLPHVPLTLRETFYGAMPLPHEVSCYEHHVRDLIIHITAVAMAFQETVNPQDPPLSVVDIDFVGISAGSLVTAYVIAALEVVQLQWERMGMIKMRARSWVTFGHCIPVQVWWLLRVMSELSQVHMLRSTVNTPQPQGPYVPVTATKQMIKQMMAHLSAVLESLASISWEVETISAHTIRKPWENPADQRTRYSSL